MNKPVRVLKLPRRINAVSAASDCRSKGCSREEACDHCKITGLVISGLKEEKKKKGEQGARSYSTILWFAGRSSIDGKTWAATWNTQFCQKNTFLVHKWCCGNMLTHRRGLTPPLNIERRYSKLLPTAFFRSEGVKWPECSQTLLWQQHYCIFNCFSLILCYFQEFLLRNRHVFRRHACEDKWNTDVTDYQLSPCPLDVS